MRIIIDWSKKDTFPIIEITTEDVSEKEGKRIKEILKRMLMAHGQECIFVSDLMFIDSE